MKKNEEVIEEQIIDESSNISEEKPKKKKSKDKVKTGSILSTIFLIMTILILVASCGIYVYLKKQNEIIDKDLADYKNNIQKVENKISNDEKAKEEKQTEYEKLQTELKEKIEELKIWEDLEKKLKQALS